jgi:hypothetical protein
MRKRRSTEDEFFTCNIMYLHICIGAYKAHTLYIKWKYYILVATRSFRMERAGPGSLEVVVRIRTVIDEESSVQVL